MATLRDIQNRLKAVKNIQKITKSMKIVSAAKFSKAEKELRPARPYGHGASEFFEKAEVLADEKEKNHLIVVMSSDRGLCGGIHSNLVKMVKASIPEKPAGSETKIICVGDKARGALGRLFADNMLMHFVEIGRKPPTFGDASVVADCILTCGFDFDFGELYYNVFKSVVMYTPTAMPLYNLDQVSNAGKISLYDSIDEDVLRSYNEFSLASLIFFAMKEGAASEQSSRMSAMDNATKNAGEMIDRLTLLYNRKRQSVITTELIEIISGASALE